MKTILHISLPFYLCCYLVFVFVYCKYHFHWCEQIRK